MTTEAERFRASFERWARSVRIRRTLRYVLHGTSLGLVVGIAFALGCWALGHGGLRPFALVSAVIGAAGGYALARRRAFSDADVALYLDSCLGSREAIATALELPDGDASHPIRAAALTALTEGDRRSARPRILTRHHLALPASLAAIGWIAFLPLPQKPPPPPGTAEVRLEDVPGLVKIEKLRELEARDPVQKERLEKMARDAERLRRELREGMERRKAQAEIARLRDAIAAERLSLGDKENRAGFEAAMARLSAEPSLRDAAKALGDRDMKGFDEALEQLANAREQRDRELAQRALEEAEELARREGAKDVAEMLKQSRELMERRRARAELLRELAEALKDSVGEPLEDFDADPSDASAERLADALAKALEQLSPEERKRLAERLQKQIGKGTLSPDAEGSLEDWAEYLATPEGQRELLEELRRLAEQDFENDEARRQEALEDAERGGAEAEGDVQGRSVPIPVPGPGTPAPGPSAGGKGPESGSGNESGNAAGNSSGNASGEPAGGKGDDTGRGKHDGRTDPVPADELRARAQGRIDERVPMSRVEMGRGAAKAGETANVQGTGALREVGESEVSAVERSEIPEEYREQVGRYFQP